MIRKLYIGLAALALLSQTATAAETSSQTNSKSSEKSDWKAAVQQFDNTFWQAYNRCDIAMMRSLIVKNFEFYHDKGGITIGNTTFEAAMKQGICGNPDRRIRREAMEDSIQIFPMYDKGKLYGALISGAHQFYVSEKGGAEHLDGRARFTHLLLLENGTWQLSRVLSYDHGPVKYESKRVEITLSTAELDQLTGTYTTKRNVSFKLMRSGNTLILSDGNINFTFYPESNDTFFLKERDLTLSFPATGTDGQQRFIVKEDGGEVDEAVRTH